MKRLHLMAAVILLVLGGAACKKDKPKETPKEEPGKKPDKKTEPAKAGPTALDADKDYASGKIQAALMEVRTKVDIPMGPVGKIVDDVKKAQDDSMLSQTLVVSEARGKMVFTTDNFYIPKGTELRYNPAHKKYVLSDLNKKEYWAMTGGEIGNLLEGGPAMTRSDYTITVTDTKDKETIAGVEAIKSDAEIGFKWSVKTKSGKKEGTVKVKLAIWHSADEKLKKEWGGMMVDFLTVPFQDPAGQKVVDELKKKVKFPVKWSMEVINDGQKKEEGEAHPKLTTVAQKLDITEIDRAELASPPADFKPAAGPYEFGEGGQTADKDLLGKIPAKKGNPPKNVEPPTEDEK